VPTLRPLRLADSSPTMSKDALSPDLIWESDLFGRKSEALDLIAYIDSVVAREMKSHDSKAYTIAVEGGYGEGKSFFLKRLAQHIGLNHPVASVDAWADDLADEPLTALAATLEDALAPLQGQREIEVGVGSFLSKAGIVAKIVGWGVAKRAAGLLITSQAVGAAEQLLVGTTDDVAEAMKHGLEDTGKDLVSDATDASKAVNPKSVMRSRIAEFREGQRAISDMKGSLSAIVQALRDSPLKPPIVILIDELDRCRPTYALKLLEQIKHLFDVPGLVFILALNAEQLSHSVSGAYGNDFDGRGYLRRFLDREYQLATPDLERFLAKLMREAGLSAKQLKPMSMGRAGDGPQQVKLSQVIAIYMQAYGLSARDAYNVVDMLQTCSAIAQQNVLLLAYLLPMIFGQLKGLPRGSLAPVVNSTDWVCYYREGSTSSIQTEISLSGAATSFQSASQKSDHELTDANDREDGNFFDRVILHSRHWNAIEQPVHAPERYPDLVRTVARFRMPEMERQTG